VFAILIPPPVCVGAGIFFALSRESAITRTGAWANVAAIFGHGLAAISILQDFFA
jgi:hypothetical protein